MNGRRNLLTIFSISILFGLMSSCAPQVTFYVTKPPQLGVQDVENISMGEFKDSFSKPIKTPRAFNRSQLADSRALKPNISRFVSNKPAADLVRAMVVAGLSKSSQYKILKSEPSSTPYTGVLPDRSRTAILKADVKFFHYTIESAEDVFYTLLAEKGANTIQEQLQLLAAKETTLAIAKRAKKGFKVPTPYIETFGAMEVEFDLIRESDRKRIVPSQVLRSYFVQKWGGEEESSHLPSILKKVIVTQFSKKLSISEQITEQLADLKRGNFDPQEFLALGGRLKSDPTLPPNPLDVKISLSKHIVDTYLKQISQYTVETTLDVAGGDAIAVNYIRGNAFELAINRLENIERTEEDSFNLGLSYESIAEYRQAARYYQEALDKDPGNQTYLQSLERVTP